MDEKRRQRLQFLHELYRLTRGSESTIVDMRTIGATYNFDDNTTISITQYLKGEGLLKFVALGGVIGITHHGILEVEEALTHENSPTEHFPPARSVNIIRINQMTNSQIQQSSINSSQSYSLNAKNSQTLIDIIQSMKRILEDPSFSEHKEKKNDLEAEIRTIEGAMSSSKPKITIIKESLSSAKNILETVSSVYATALPLITKITSWISSLG